MKHLFVDISAHGFGHLAQTAPLLNLLADCRPLRLTIRSGLSQTQLARRIRAPFTHFHAASDFGFAMRDALNVDLEASAERYRDAYADWPQRVANEAGLLGQLAPDLVFSNVSPLPLAGATAARIPAVAMCSLNWADLFAHYYAGEAWAAPIHAAMQAAYAGANCFLRLTPGMPMDTLSNARTLDPVSFYAHTPPTVTRSEAAQRLDLPQDRRWLLLALGGIAHRLPVEDWPELPGTQLLVPADWNTVPRHDITPYHDGLLPFSDLLPVVDAVLGKPGYGTFVEAACCGLPVLYLQRPDWPEAACLEHWLHQNTRASAIPPNAGLSGDFAATLETLLRSPAPPRPEAKGSEEALRRINALLDGGDTIKP